jgi:hypothetical protein
MRDNGRDIVYRCHCKKIQQDIYDPTPCVPWGLKLIKSQLTKNSFKTNSIPKFRPSIHK